MKNSSTNRSIRCPALARIVELYRVLVLVAALNAQRTGQCAIDRSRIWYGGGLADCILIGILDKDVEAIDGRISARSFVLLVLDDTEDRRMSQSSRKWKH